MIHIFGIKNCNSVKKALDWMNENAIEYTFHDFKKEGVQASQIQDWAKFVNWESLINKKGTTWKKIPSEVQATMTNLENSIPVLMENTSLIKRPVIVGPSHVILGFDQNTYEETLK